MQIRLAAEAEEDLHSIWIYVAAESTSADTADALTDRILSRLFLLTRHPYLGRSRADEFGTGMRSLASGEYVMVYRVEETEIQVLRIVHGRRDLDALFDL